MQNLINFLTTQFPQAEVFPSTDTDYICVRHTIGSSKFIKYDENNNEFPFTVAITNTVKYHADTVKLMLIQNNISKELYETFLEFKNHEAGS